MNKTIANISINTIRDAELEAVLKQFLSTIGQYKEMFGINEMEIERLHLELQFFSWVLDTERKVRAYLNDLKHFKKLSRTIPKYEIMESLQNLTVPGTEQFYRQPQGGHSAGGHRQGSARGPRRTTVSVARKAGLGAVA